VRPPIPPPMMRIFIMMSPEFLGAERQFSAARAFEHVAQQTSIPAPHLNSCLRCVRPL
jgi:hypothetical protein